LRAYTLTVSELQNRRTQKKAHTRETIRAVAQSLFAEQGFDGVTIADVAQAADVAVQTVFNHFSTKEELFFDGRTPWVEGPATAVRSRPAHVEPLTALRTYLVDLVQARVGARGELERQRYLSVLQASEALVVRERGLVRECEERLAAALAQAWHGQAESPDVWTAAQLTAATWTATIRVIIIDRRVTDPTDPLATAAELGGLTDVVLRRLEAFLPPVALAAASNVAQTDAVSFADAGTEVTSGRRISSTMHSTVAASIAPSPVAV
jgi:AcrR family transcriptional regulator